MMSLWTPGGEHEVPRESPPSSQPPGAAATGGRAPRLEGPEGPIDLDSLSPEQREAAEEMLRQMAEAQQRIAEAPVEAVLANHLVGFYELAAIHLQQQPPNLEAASVAIDAFAAVLERVAGRLGEAEDDLQAMLSNLQMAFVEIKREAPA
jgi:hypothetical protein